MYQWTTKLLIGTFALCLLFSNGAKATDICDFTRVPSGNITDGMCAAFHLDGVAGYHATGADILKYVSSGLAIGEFTDVSTTGVATGDLLYYSGSGFVPLAPAEIGIINRECVRLSNVGEDAATGTTDVNLYFSNAITVTGVYAFSTVAPVGSTAVIDINEAGTTIMSTNKLSIDASEKTSGTAATAAGVTDTAIAANAEITFDIDQIGSSTAGQGYVACIEYVY